MNKKTYINPELEVVEIKMQRALLLPVSNTEVEEGLAPVLELDTVEND